MHDGLHRQHVLLHRCCAASVEQVRSAHASPVREVDPVAAGVARRANAIEIADPVVAGSLYWQLCLVSTRVCSINCLDMQIVAHGELVMPEHAITVRSSSMVGADNKYASLAGHKPRIRTIIEILFTRQWRPLPLRTRTMHLQWYNTINWRKEPIVIWKLSLLVDNMT